MQLFRISRLFADIVRNRLIKIFVSCDLTLQTVNKPSNVRFVVSGDILGIPNPRAIWESTWKFQPVR